MELGSRPLAILHGRPTNDLMGTRPFGDSHRHGKGAREWADHYEKLILTTQDPCDPPQQTPPSFLHTDPSDDPCDSWAFIPKD